MSGVRAMQHTLPGDGNSPSSIGEYSPYGELSPYGASNTSYSSLDSIDPRLTQMGSPSQYQQQIGLSGMSPVASPGQLTTAASSPASLHYQNASPAQVTGYTTDSVGSYFYHNPNYPQPSARQRQRPASSPQGWVNSPNQNVNNFVLSPRLPYRPAHYDENQDIEADPSGSGPYVCGCGAKFGRPTDLERHRKTSKKHNKDPRGPACPIDPCNYHSRFTRVDNFKAHYMKQHGMSSDDADEFIREWKDGVE
ncbi:hypothetical protein B9Z19DRAFT_1195003 [Tuber borchii]|uniref:Uncharacterized protein n=1 Tax=Tuber borchii TaxID=42251 RepID=A0A2T6ZKQ1_TUBBO|nr:hypothetical protein B9Z19DRAFT_1195003 [Tuber borchii]